MRIQLTPALAIDHLPLALPCELATLQKSLGKPRKTRLANDIYTWDALGIAAYCSPGATLVDELGFFIAPSEYRFSPKQTFAGVLEWEGTAFDLPADAGKAFAKVMKRASGDRYARKLVSGGLRMYFDLDPAAKTLARIDVTPQSEPTFGVEPPAGKGVKFADFNFKLAAVQQLMFEQELLDPRFDVRRFAEAYTKKQIDPESGEIIPEVRGYFERFPIPAALLQGITTLSQDGGDDIYLQLCPGWDGEDDRFNIHSAADAKHLPKLKRAVLFHDDDDAILKAFEKRGVKAKFL